MHFSMQQEANTGVISLIQGNINVYVSQITKTSKVCEEMVKRSNPGPPGHTQLWSVCVPHLGCI